MSFDDHEYSDEQELRAEINMVPLIDVMLVLLVIFIVTAPLLTHSVNINLPKASSTESIIKPQSIELALDETGQIYWGTQKIDPTELKIKLQNLARSQPDTELHIRADRLTTYEKVAQLMSMAAQLGLTHLSLVTQPDSS